MSEWSGFIRPFKPIRPMIYRLESFLRRRYFETDLRSSCEALRGKYEVENPHSLLSFCQQDSSKTSRIYEINGIEKQNAARNFKPQNVLIIIKIIGTTFEHKKMKKEMKN